MTIRKLKFLRDCVGTISLIPFFSSFQYLFAIVVCTMEQVNRENDRPRAAVIGNSVRLPQRPVLRASELGRKRASLRKVDRHSSDSDDYTTSTRRSKTGM